MASSRLLVEARACSMRWVQNCIDYSSFLICSLLLSCSLDFFQIQLCSCFFYFCYKLLYLFCVCCYCVGGISSIFKFDQIFIQQQDQNPSIMINLLSNLLKFMFDSNLISLYHAQFRFIFIVKVQILILQTIINPIIMQTTRLLLIFAFLIIIASTKQMKLLRNCQTEFQKMTEAYKKGDTSLSFSIAVKVYFAVKALHNDLDIEQPKLSYLQNSELNCQQLMTEIVKGANAADWQTNFEQIIDKIGHMQQSCTNSDFEQPSNQVEGGFQNECALCVVILRVMENYVNYYKVGVSDFVNKEFCGLFDGYIKPTCEVFIHYAGPIIIETLYKKEPSDKVCLALGLCTDKNCRIVKEKAQLYNLDLQDLEGGIKGLNRPSPWKWLKHLFVDHFGNGHFPAFDLDNDTYSDISTFRGYHWRGADCNQMQAGVYPGRKAGSKLIDHDCNGIFGVDPKGKIYEDKFCAPYKRYGVAVIGDSAGAHFSIPEKFFNVSMMQKGTFKDLLPRLADELDIPMDSAYTGHRNTTYHSHSIYKFLRSWNLCNNNDYQNIAVNGATVGNSWGNIPALSRSQTEDYPLMMFLELIGNDVCKKSFDSMTKPADFKRDAIRLLNYIDGRIPAGSHMVILGLGDGSLLYDNLHADIHPLNVTYQTIYDFLNCLKISPCWGWLNSNETIRKFTTERAQNLSKIYGQIINEYKFKNFDIIYYDFPAMEILERKLIEGGDPHTMIERCDGFHPNVEFNSYLADWLWYNIRIDRPDWLGPQNPHNEQIKHIFGLHDFS